MTALVFQNKIQTHKMFKRMLFITNSSAKYANRFDNPCYKATLINT